MIVISIRSMLHSRHRISLAEIKAPWCHCYSCLSPQVTSNDKTPTVISSALEKHSQDPKQASRYELIQLLPEGKGKHVKRKQLCLKQRSMCGHVLSFDGDLISPESGQRSHCLRSLISSCGLYFGAAEACHSINKSICDDVLVQ